MREPPPPYKRVDVEFGDATFPGRARFGFEANFAPSVQPAADIALEAGRRGTWILEFVPDAPVPPGAVVGFRKLDLQFKVAWRLQDYWPHARNYVTVEDSAGNPLPFECDTLPKPRGMFAVTLPNGLEAGDRIVARIGDQRRGGPGLAVQQVLLQGGAIGVGVRLPPEDTYRRITGGDVTANVVPCPPLERYHVFAPSTVEPGAAFRAVAMPLDAHGNVMAAGEGVAVTGSDGARCETAEGPEHALRIRARAGREGIARLELSDASRGIRARSNPVRAGRLGDWHVYWGEFHAHGYDAVEINVLSPLLAPERLYRYGRDVTRLDFCATGSHIFREHPEAPREWWSMVCDAARKFDEPGRYVPFIGCEWRDAERKGGDRNIVWRDLDAEVPDPTWRIGEIYDRFRGRPTMLTPHVGGAIAMPYHHDGDVEPLCEMVSGHGQSEWFAQAYLQKGCRVGLIGGSDGHSGTPGHPRTVATTAGGRFGSALRMRDSGWGGGPVLAVLAERLDREALWEAFRARRTYASTGARAILEFTANGAPMGSEIQATRDVTLEVRVVGTGPIERVDLVRGPNRLARWDGRGDEFAADHSDRPPNGDTYYYLRVEQTDGEMLWSSPVFVRSSCGGRDESLPAWNEPEAVDLDSLGGGEAEAHLANLLNYLAAEESDEAFSDLTPWKVVDSPRGRYAVFLGHYRGHRVRLHWFFEFEMPRLRIEAGWVQYGRERIEGAKWARPVPGFR